METQHIEKKDEGWCGWGASLKHDRLDTIGWTLFFVLVAVLMLAGGSGIVSESAGWAAFFTGAGALLLVFAAIRRLIPRYRRPVAFEVVCGLFMLIAGLSGSF